jgi:hypothetical protein
MVGAIPETMVTPAPREPVVNMARSVKPVIQVVMVSIILTVAAAAAQYPVPVVAAVPAVREKSVAMEVGAKHLSGGPTAVLMGRAVQARPAALGRPVVAVPGD